MRLERDGDRIVLEMATPAQVPVIRTIPGARWSSKERQWSFPLSWATCVVARGVLGDSLQVGPALAEWAKAERRDRIDPALALASAEDAPGPDVLYQYQRVGTQFLRIAGSALLADEMGTGKTIQTIMALEADDAYPALVVCPNSVKAVWEREYARWAPGRTIAVAGNGTATAKKAVEQVANGLADVLVVNWESLRSLSRLAPYGSIRLQGCKNCEPGSTRRPDLCQKEDKVLNLIRWGAVVADEAHRGKSPRADQTRALWAIGDRADRRIALTGTPIANSAADLWSVMRFVAPSEYPSKGAWIDRYALTEANFFSGGMDVLGLNPATRPELDRYFRPRFLRRTKAEVLPDLPPKVYQRRDVFLSGKQKKAYDQLSAGMIAEIEGGVILADNALTASLRLRQLASAYGTVKSTVGPDWDKQVKLEEPSSKLDELEAVLAELGDRQVVVFAESSQLINLAYDRLLSAGMPGVATITGSTPQGTRDRNIEEFQAGDVRVLMLTVAAGGEGITLTAADTCIFLQRPWSAVLNAQAEDRLHRVGQEGQSVTYIDLVTAGTIEERVFEALAEKTRRLEDVVA